tara:strand:- start:277 stop:483 length:207 start_codon:yes stop_codon:yes gene_type:complete
LKFGQVVDQDQEIHAVITVQDQQEDLEEVTLLKQLVHVQDVSTQFVLVVHGLVQSHTLVAEEWDVVHM